MQKSSQFRKCFVNLFFGACSGSLEEEPLRIYGLIATYVEVFEDSLCGDAAASLSHGHRWTPI